MGLKEGQGRHFYLPLQRPTGLGCKGIGKRYPEANKVRLERSRGVGIGEQQLTVLAGAEVMALEAAKKENERDMVVVGRQRSMERNVGESAAIGSI